MVVGIISSILVGFLGLTILVGTLSLAFSVWIDTFEDIKHWWGGK